MNSEPSLIKLDRWKEEAEKLHRRIAKNAQPWEKRKTFCFCFLIRRRSFNWSYHRNVANDFASREERFHESTIKRRRSIWLSIDIAKDNGNLFKPKKTEKTSILNVEKNEKKIGGFFSFFSVNVIDERTGNRGKAALLSIRRSIIINAYRQLMERRENIFLSLFHCRSIKTDLLVITDRFVE